MELIYWKVNLISRLKCHLVDMVIILGTMMEVKFYMFLKNSGKDYALSTNTDIYEYDVATGKTINLTEGMMGYDTNPAFSKDGVLAFLSMKRDGYEADKNDIIIMYNGVKTNLTEHWDETISSFKWSEDGKRRSE